MAQVLPRRDARRWRRQGHSGFVRSRRAPLVPEAAQCVRLRRSSWRGRPTDPRHGRLRARRKRGGLPSPPSRQLRGLHGRPQPARVGKTPLGGRHQSGWLHRPAAPRCRGSQAQRHSGSPVRPSWRARACPVQGVRPCGGRCQQFALEHLLQIFRPRLPTETCLRPMRLTMSSSHGASGSRWKTSVLKTASCRV